MNQITVKPFTYPTGATAFVVSGRVGGKQRRAYPKTEEDAVTIKQNWERENLNMTPLPSTTTRLTADQCRDAEACFHRLEGKPMSLVQAVEFAITNYRPAFVAMKLAEAITLFREVRKKEGCRADSLNNLRFRLTAFANWFGDKLVSDVLADDVSNFIYRDTGKPRAKRTILNDRLVLSNFFNWCVDFKKCASANPCASVKPPKMRGRKVPERLTLAQCRSLLVAARDYQDGRALPYFVAGLFGGVRPVETTRLSWDLFDLTRTRRIDLGEHIAKMGEHRYVSLTPNMLEWLEPHALKKTPFRISRLDFDTVRKLAGITHWPDDVLRHTAVSNFLAAGHSDREATERHGHSVSVMLKHYRDRVTPEDAKEFWTLAPANVQSTPIQLHKAA